MANATVTVLEADGVTQTDVVVLDVGRQAAAASKSLALSTEDKTVLDSLDTKLSTIDGRVDGLETLITSTNTKLDTVITSLQLIDNVTQTTSAPTGADTALVVGIHPASQNDNGRADAADSAPTAMSNEDKAVLDAIETAVESLDGGLSVFRSLDLDESEEEVKATAGVLHKLRLTNRTTSARYVKLYNATAANVTVGSTTPIDTIVVPGGTSADLCTVVTETFGTKGLTFSTALSMAATTGLADNDTGAPGANDVIVSAYYK